MSQELVRILIDEGYDSTTANEIVKLAHEKPDDVAQEYLEEMIDNTAAITRYIRSRGRPKPLSHSRKESPPVKKTQPPKPSQNRPLVNTQWKVAGSSAMSASSSRQAEPYARPLVQRGSALHKQIVQHQSAPKPKSDKEFTNQVKIESIKDLDAAIKKLELDDPERRPCNCMGSRHGLCDLAPNCLNCGRIVCAKEGLGRCLGCGDQLVDNATLGVIFGVLKGERDQIISTMGKRALKSANIDPELVLTPSVQDSFSKAQSNMERLLGYQDSSAVRTKIIDQAADFETPSMGTNMWASPLEQARQLKEQQRRERRSEETRKMRRGQGRKVISIDIRGNKVIQTAEDAYETESEESEPEEAENEHQADFETQPTAFYDASSHTKVFIKPVYDLVEPKQESVQLNEDRVARDDEEVLAW